MAEQESFAFAAQDRGASAAARPTAGKRARGPAATRPAGRKRPAEKPAKARKRASAEAEPRARRGSRDAAAAPAPVAPAKGRALRAPRERNRATAADLARQQRDISVSEFFAKNRHLLGFDNPSKALLTTVKEGVDNALDACEEAGILPDIRVEIRQLDETRFRVAIEDNGPGIVRAQVPKIFGRLLYGSKFHRLRQSRGQQGIGISAAGMYGLLTTGKPIVITTRTGTKHPAHHFELVIDTKTNEPKVKVDDEVKWEKDHGTRVEIELEGAWRGGQHSVDAYVRQISLANPHARIDYVPPKGEGAGEPVLFPRVADELPPETAEIKPHPYGVELGVLMQMLRDTQARNLRACLSGDFSRVSTRLAEEICATARVAPSRRPQEMTRDEAEKVHRAIQATKIMAPPTDCIAPIGQELVERALRAEVKADFYAAVTRRPAVYRGNPFLVEVGLAYGGEQPAEEPIQLFRFANRVPLQYQQGACAITKAVTSTEWRSYQMQQPRGALPLGPMVLLVHIASVWVPFTSESKEAIASYPEIVKEMRLGLQECGRQVGLFIRKRRRDADEAKKRAYIEQYIPQVAIGLQQILALSDPQRDRVIVDLKDVLERSRKA
jgi:DNA topoisomerase-6 subunit B